MENYKELLTKALESSHLQTRRSQKNERGNDGHCVFTLVVAGELERLFCCQGELQLGASQYTLGICPLPAESWKKVKLIAGELP